MKNSLVTRALTLSIACAFASSVQADELRLLTWGGYAPQNVIDMFEKETGHVVKVTNSNNEDMISKLRATGGAGFDLAQPSQDRITSAQQAFNIYQAIDMSRINSDLIIPSMLKSTNENTAIGSDIFAVPHIWGTSGLVVNRKLAADVKDYTDLCNAAYEGKVSYRLKRPTLIGFAFAMGEDPFAAYGDTEKYQAILDKVEQALIACKPNVKTYWSGGDALINLVRSEEVVAAMAWDAGGWKLNRDNADVTFVAPASGALGWIDTFAIPRKSKSLDAAYAWINFVNQPKVAALITEAAGNFTAALGADEFVNDVAKAQYQESFSTQDLENIKWYPPVPAGLEDLEGMALDRIKAAQ
ncbi:extracellular solute-binding protein [Alginatibacterium sediminis]|uniref:Extracellular solute-binding protein n=1 Tax=Alginatibacterium sediminis TaxID=2164068 RepID=A0A420E7U3_9ALTE|nr:extracellular solute-binding protein [Alginatibacterium sediminis]RKF15609.1 extracellular solute-binding protein [Alginatibacterium sediminis]